MSKPNKNRPRKAKSEVKPFDINHMERLCPGISERIQMSFLDMAWKDIQDPLGKAERARIRAEKVAAFDAQYADLAKAYFGSWETHEDNPFK